MRLKALLLSAITALTVPQWSLAESGIDDSTVYFGQIAALDGPAAQLGLGMRTGLLAAFEEANRNGGVNGRQLSLESWDDGYEPDRSADHLNRMIREGKHFALIGSVGTPTNSVLQPIATEAQFPLIGPFTGAGFLRNTSLGNVFNVRGSYDAETEQWIAHLADNLNLTRIAILYQDDSFGLAGLSGVNKALGARGMSLVAEGTYTRNTTDVKDALLSIRDANPEAVVMVGAYKPIGEFIKLSRSYEFTPEFVTISFVGSQALADELWPEGAGVVISQVVPFPWDNSVPIVSDYHEAMQANDVNALYGFVSLEGYMVGRIAIEALGNAGDNPTRESFLDAFASMGTFDLGGIEITLGADDNQGIDEIFMTRLLPDGFFEPM
ncbi:ABC transporter substrate-binding protein [Yoonia sediminilitoris]|uniref:Amino acid/amide ABC transporter substrate-binding protein (HAAT family) n=1 Tax=Yoonia sediminilitoris TaxID=1286148 RepID=A0A2T6KQ49_9RHOB|nr:ABC transporter substrate-binding protein [Yoonia sediminilitoris]PUB18683.1 amino acid/amide ABC transporter substrate-binding protein (HAAT family) [Yoonia sediminilitoris]RCW98851.1 amino acid/amide ABC transporter substrate-binding protein (HAAT family) [Yoonia sediminilitoris]